MNPVEETENEYGGLLSKIDYKDLSYIQNLQPMLTHPLLPGILFVVSKSKFVKIDYLKILEFVKNFRIDNMGHWLMKSPFNINLINEEQKFGFLFLFNSLSFSYWGDKKWMIHYEDRDYDGTWAMIICLGKAILEGIPLLDTNYLKNLKREQLKKIFLGTAEIPLFNERLHILKEIGEVTHEKFEGELENILIESNGDAFQLINKIIQNFRSFNDISYYGGECIKFYKRAQLLTSDVNHLLESNGNKELNNLNNLTACADYKIPRVLRDFGILKLDFELERQIQSKIEIPHGSEVEVEIRANTILAVELIKENINKIYPRISSMAINDCLWCIGQKPSPFSIEYHRTRTTAY